MSQLSRKSLEHLAALARLELSEKESEKLLADLEKILNHFEELQEIDTQDVLAATGGTRLKNVFRMDEKGVNKVDGTKAIQALPDTEKGFVKIPPVFSAEGGSPPKADELRAYASGGE